MMHQNKKLLKYRLVSFVTICAFSFATGCSTAQHYNTPNLSPTELEGNVSNDNANTGTQEETIGAGFLFRLANLEDRSLNGSFRVAFDGKITLPYNITLKATGLTLPQFQEQVAIAYRPYFKGGSRVKIDLIEKAFWVDIRGLATKPGRYLLKQDTSIDEVIAKGGGFAKDSPAKFMKISATNNGSRTIDLDRYYRTGEPSTLPVWSGGEQIFFQSEEGAEDIAGITEKTSIKILGEVKRPGDISYRPGADFLYYLTEAGGPTRDMNPNKIQIYRSNNSAAVEEFSVDKKNQFPLIKKGDTVLVYADRPSEFERAIQSGAGIAGIISAIALIIVAGQRR